MGRPRLGKEDDRQEDDGDGMLLRESKRDKKEEERQKRRHFNDNDGDDDNDGEEKKGGEEKTRDFSGATGQRQVDQRKIDGYIEMEEKRTASNGRAVDPFPFQTVTKDIALIFDFHLDSNRRPLVLFQTVGHVSGATFYYRYTSSIQRLHEEENLAYPSGNVM